MIISDILFSLKIEITDALTPLSKRLDYLTFRFSDLKIFACGSRSRDKNTFGTHVCNFILFVFDLSMSAMMYLSGFARSSRLKLVTQHA